jgi:TRAP transporter TAXI family solute receptor
LKAGANGESKSGTALLIAAAALTVIIAARILFVEAGPPRSIVFAAGPRDGQYYCVARQYARELNRFGIQVTVRATRGSAENLELLSEAGGNVSVALVQGGTADAERHRELRTLGSLYWEPLWIFLRNDVEATRLNQLAGLRIAVGAEGSGTRPIARHLLNVAGVGDDAATMISVGGQEAVDQMEDGAVDAACFVAGVDAPYVQRLGHNPQFRLMDLEHQQALTRRFRQLSAVNVPAGLLDIEDNLPRQDTALVGPAAMLVVRPTLHSALASVLLEAARRIHGAGDALSAPREFPSMEFVDLPLSRDAELYYRHGPPLLQRLLPYWLATFVDRVKFLALPLVMLVMPFVRAAPPLVRWRIRRKVYVWYGKLRQLDHLIGHGLSSAEARSRLRELQNLEEQIAHVIIPLGYMAEYYNLRVHLSFVQHRLEALLNDNAGAPPTDETVTREPDYTSTRMASRRL